VSANSGVPRISNQVESLSVFHARRCHRKIGTLEAKIQPGKTQKARSRIKPSSLSGKLGQTNNQTTTEESGELLAALI